MGGLKHGRTPGQSDMTHSSRKRLPFDRLQRAQTIAMFAQSCLPPRVSGSTCSYSSHFLLRRQQYTQMRAS